MKKTQYLIMVAVLVVAQAFASSASADLGFMRINLIENELQIRTPEAGEWSYAAINTPLDVGDELWVPQGGRAELQLNNGSYIRLDGNSALQILSMDQDSSQLYLPQGNAYIYYDAPRGSVIQIDTPDASTRAFDRAVFSIGISSSYTDVRVHKGYVLTENRIGEIRVNAGNMVSLGQDTNGEIGPLGYASDWERWNHGRDERLYDARRSQSVRYLPSELRTYYSDFDNHGRWVHAPDYGYVWTPTTYISASWTPYRHGRWIWRGGDYVWLAYEPWGWAPYHYGRWAFVVNVGWCWVPPLPGSVYWGPGYVGWIRTMDYVGWVPLAPGEIYYGRGHYGRHSVNIVNVNINEVHFTNVYRNVHVHNGSILVKHQAFRSGVYESGLVDANIRDKVFTRNNMIPGPPDVKPARKGLLVGGREIPGDKRPPQPLRLQKDIGSKKMLRLVKEPNQSVFRPGQGPASLPLKKVGKARPAGQGKPALEKIQHDLSRPVQPMTQPRPVQPRDREQPRGPMDAGKGRGDDSRKQFQPPPPSRPVQPMAQPRPVQPRDREQPRGPMDAGKGRGDDSRKQFQPPPPSRPVQPMAQPRPVQPRDREQPHGPMMDAGKGRGDDSRKQFQQPPPSRPVQPMTQPRPVQPQPREVPGKPVEPRKGANGKNEKGQAEQPALPLGQQPAPPQRNDYRIKGQAR
ncbi:MAG: hypothetical protein C4563_06755 [Desulfobulbus sp.]|nr:MAG: hypothetical protein C4563_06755 [Desulfobulbus sp.]